MSRTEQTGRNRALVLAAARRVFLARGYHAASVDQIADEAGFSKGVVYSQFDGKADMFLALLEDRITERAAQNAQLAAKIAGTGDFTRLLDDAMRAEQGAPGWRLLVTEFRVLAARDPELNKRYAAAHARTVTAWPACSRLLPRDRPGRSRCRRARWPSCYSAEGRPRARAGRQPRRSRRPARGRHARQPAGMARLRRRSWRCARRGQDKEPDMIITAPDVTLLRARMTAALMSRLPGHARRLSWDPAQLAAFQRDRLRELLARATQRSPFHAARLAGIDPATFELADLPRLPVMTKTQMMASFDQVVTDRRLTRDLVDRHLAGSGADPALLLGDFVCLVSGGSSGLRGVFVQTLDEYAEFGASVTRRPFARLMALGEPAPGVTVGMVGAASSVHSTGFGAVTVTGPPLGFVSIPATLPTAELVERLNAVRPDALIGYASRLALLAREQRAGGCS